jgi:hypothetical protein
MGQLTVPATDTATYGVNVVISPGVAVDLLATTCTLHFENQDAAAQGFSVRLYWTATSTFDYLNEVGSQVSGNHAYLAPVDVPFSLSGVGAGYLWGWWGMDSPGFSGTITWWMLDDLTYCVYGAQRRQGGPDVISVTYDLALAVLSYVKANLWVAIIGFLLGQLVNVPILCSAVRPPAVQMTAQDFLHLYGLGSPQENDAARRKLASWFLWAAWSYFCECVPGSPAPIDPPILPQPRPPGLPADPNLTYLCDNNDLCTQLLKVNVALNALAVRSSSIEQLLTLVQRQGVPFGYVPGTVHAGLSAAGDFTVADLIGLAVDITTRPATYPSFGGDPDTYHNLGKISVGTGDGWERSWWATHDPYLILPISGAITKVGYTFPSGIVATITELVREP